MIDLRKLDVDINPDYTMMKKLKNGLYLSQEQIDILNNYNIDYLSFNNLSDLILEITEVYEDTDDDILSNLLDVLEERNYYENFKK